MEPNEVIETDRLNAGYSVPGKLFLLLARKPLRRSMAGCFIAITLQCWKTHFIKISVAGDCKLGRTLDPMSHDTEWNESR
jgi:tartrate dehydratase alpha subunit/fumarate hydratase class I-like protein